jgi:hypothetical protein
LTSEGAPTSTLVVALFVDGEKDHPQNAASELIVECTGRLIVECLKPILNSQGM